MLVRLILLGADVSTFFSEETKGRGEGTGCGNCIESGDGKGRGIGHGDLLYGESYGDACGYEAGSGNFIGVDFTPRYGFGYNYYYEYLSTGFPYKGIDPKRTVCWSD